MPIAPTSLDARRRPAVADDNRMLLRNVAAIEWTIGLTITATYPILFGDITLMTTAIAASTAVGLATTLLVPWDRISKQWFILMSWAACGPILAAPWAFGQPAMTAAIVLPMILMTSFFWERRGPTLSFVAIATAAAITVTVTYGGGSAIGPLLILVPIMLLVVMMVGVLANRVLSTQALRERLESTIEALSGALNARDGYTGAHSTRTVELVDLIAAELRLNDQDRRHVGDVALLHDVGKLGVPDEILNSPERLTEAEWKVMRRHPEVGEEIVRRVPGMELVAKAIRHEHERWDGGGYPDGLAGNEIPLASRIVLVCDAYHAMTSDRPYRNAMPDDEARAELIRHAGAQFDPRIVDALLRSLDGRLRSAHDQAPPATVDPADDARSALAERQAGERRAAIRIV